MKLLIAGGGTGGHVFPALAIAEEWLVRGKEREVVLVGTERGIEMKLVPQAGLPLETVLEQLELLGGEVVPTLRKEFENLRAPEARAEAPTHASLVAEKYGDGPTRRPTPNANQGNNLSGPSPYEDSAELVAAAEAEAEAAASSGATAEAEEVAG